MNEARWRDAEDYVRRYLHPLDNTQLKWLTTGLIEVQDQHWRYRVKKELKK